jgi:hypothetical protein
MIEGNIENEIGDQFIGNGRYRELRQFHLDQIAEGNKIIQNNLKSLQKLFEVFGCHALPKCNLLGVESQLLPPTEDIAEAGLGLALKSQHGNSRGCRPRATTAFWRTQFLVDDTGRYRRSVGLGN